MLHSVGSGGNPLTHAGRTLQGSGEQRMERGGSGSHTRPNQAASACRSPMVTPPMGVGVPKTISSHSVTITVLPELHWDSMRGEKSIQVVLQLLAYYTSGKNNNTVSIDLHSFKLKFKERTV